MRVVGTFITLLLNCMMWNSTTQLVESTWLCDRTWVQVLFMPFMCYFICAF